MALKPLMANSDMAPGFSCGFLSLSKHLQGYIVISGCGTFYQKYFYVLGTKGHPLYSRSTPALRTNPLGMRGEVAEEFYFLVKNMWCGQYRSISPRDFKVGYISLLCVCV